MKNYLLKNLTATFVIVFTVELGGAWAEDNKSNLPACKGEDISKWDKCFGALNNNTGQKEYIGEFKAGKYDGYGVLYSFDGGDNFIYKGQFKAGWKNGYGIKYKEKDEGTKYIGEYKDGLMHGKGIFYVSGNVLYEGIFEKGEFIRNLKVLMPEENIPKINNSENKKLTDGNISEKSLIKKGINLQVTNTQANAEGDFVITIQTGTDTASLKINGEEQGGKQDGSYSIKRVARAGQTTQFTISAKDVYGNTDSKTIAVTRQITASSQIKYAELNPALVKTQPNKDAVAIIIGIADYKNLPRADYANDDARVFYDYAIRGLGVRAENIKLLVDGDAGQGEILKTFKTWLPSRVKSTTDVYVYYSGHGLPSADGQNLYFLPQLADRDLIEDTAVAQSRINAAIQAAKPKSVTIFLDSCYSGAARTGQTLLASARPISLKANTQTFPSDFTVFTASTAEQISSSSNELKHGIFSYYLMRGMEGDADTNKDGKITTGEMHSYLLDNVTRQASLANRVQQPQLVGDANRVLVGR